MNQIIKTQHFKDLGIEEQTFIGFFYSITKNIRITDPKDLINPEYHNTQDKCIEWFNNNGQQYGQISQIKVENKKSTFIPKKVFDIIGIRSFSWTNSQIKSIPVEIGNLSSLQILILSGNQLTALPETLKKLDSLESIVLDHNAFETFPSVLLEMPKIKQITLNDNKINEIPSDISKIKNLKFLTLYNNNLTKLPKELLDLPLEQLSFTGNPITKLPKEILNSKRVCIESAINEVINEENKTLTEEVSSIEITPITETPSDKRKVILQVRDDVGFENFVALRGVGIEGASWNKGIPMQYNTQQRCWEVEVEVDISTPIEFKCVRNDKNFETGSNRTIEGSKLSSDTSNKLTVSNLKF